MLAQKLPPKEDIVDVVRSNQKSNERGIIGQAMDIANGGRISG